MFEKEGEGAERKQLRNDKVIRYCSATHTNWNSHTTYYEHSSAVTHSVIHFVSSFNRFHANILFYNLQVCFASAVIDKTTDT